MRVHGGECVGGGAAIGLALGLGRSISRAAAWWRVPSHPASMCLIRVPSGGTARGRCPRKSPHSLSAGAKHPTAMHVRPSWQLERSENRIRHRAKVAQLRSAVYAIWGYDRPVNPPRVVRCYAALQ
jgi:hypothetical protein